MQKYFYLKKKFQNSVSNKLHQLAVLVNSINDTHDMMRNVIEHIEIISLLNFKATIKR